MSQVPVNVGSTSVTIPTGFTIPSSFVQNPAATVVSTEPAPQAQVAFTTAPPNPGVAPISSVLVDIPGSTNSTAHLFPSQQSVISSKMII